MDYIKEWDPVFKEFSRILKPGGRFIFSVLHPFLYAQPLLQSSYYEIEQREERWKNYNAIVPSFRRPLGAMTSALTKADFVIEQIVEPRPVDTLEAQFPNQYNDLTTKPFFICFKTRKTE